MQHPLPQTTVYTERQSSDAVPRRQETCPTASLIGQHQHRLTSVSHKYSTTHVKPFKATVTLHVPILANLLHQFNVVQIFR